MAKHVLLLAGLLLLSACTYSVERLMRDEPLRSSLIKTCVGKGLKAKDDQNCLNAAEAQAKVTGKAVMDLFK
ncbi:MAG: EexN family lipoprotein [Gammaproteobacteria bacterium]|nr:EexN family lipoprotein [Gammaproteobacteria bacterium]MDH5692984.1 EexN family lipoprotein [Gammaproteobacteria bacterium]